MPRPPQPLPVHLRAAPFHEREARVVRWDAARLRRAGLLQPVPRVWVAPDVEVTARALTRAWARGLSSGRVVSHSSAAVLQGLPCPARRQESSWSTLELHSCAREVTSGPRCAGTDGHAWRLPPEHLRQLEDIGVTSAARTLVDAAGLPTWSLTDLVALGDAALRSGAATRSEIEGVVAWAGRRRGVVRARRVVTLLDPRAGSPRESRLRIWLVESGLPVPESQVLVLGEASDFVGLADLGWPRWRLAAEYLGEIHSETLIDDVERRRRYARAGWRVVELTRADDRSTCVELIRSALREQGWVATPGEQAA